MKKSIICFLYILACISLYGQEFKDDTIVVEGETDIVLSEKYPEELFLYDGYVPSGKSKGTFRGANDRDGAKSELLKQQLSELSREYIDIFKAANDSCDKIHIVVHGKIDQPVQLKFPIVGKYNNGSWETVAIRRITLEPKASSGGIASPSGETNPEGAGNNQKVAGSRGGSSKGTGMFSSIEKVLAPDLIKALLAIILFLLAAWCLSLAARIKKLARRFSEVSDALDVIRSSREKAPMPKAPTKSELLESIRADIPGIIASGFMPDIIRSIDEKVNQAVAKINNPVQPTFVSENVAAEEKPRINFRSSNVVYDSVTNTFSVSDKGAVHIFEIFERDGDFFLTLVDDPAIRQEFISVLGNYSKCIKVTQEASFPVKADVLENGYGHLFKEGDIFRVDTARLLNIVLR